MRLFTSPLQKVTKAQGHFDHDSIFGPSQACHEGKPNMTKDLEPAKDNQWNERTAYFPALICRGLQSLVPVQSRPPDSCVSCYPFEAEANMKSCRRMVRSLHGRLLKRLAIKLIALIAKSIARPFYGPQSPGGEDRRFGVETKQTDPADRLSPVALRAVIGGLRHSGATPESTGSMVETSSWRLTSLSPSPKAQIVPRQTPLTRPWDRRSTEDAHHLEMYLVQASASSHATVRVT